MKRVRPTPLNISALISEGMEKYEPAAVVKAKHRMFAAIERYAEVSGYTVNIKLMPPRRAAAKPTRKGTR